MAENAESRVPVAMRLPRHEVEVVSAFAAERNITKTDAFLYFLRRGIEQNPTSDSEKFSHIETLLQEILQQVSPPEKQGVESVAQAIAEEAAKFPAIKRAIVFGSFARGEAASESDIDIRLNLDREGKFSLYDHARFQKAIEQKLGRESDVLTADRISNPNLAAAIEREGVVVYDRESYRRSENPGDV